MFASHGKGANAICRQSNDETALCTEREREIEPLERERYLDTDTNTYLRLGL